MEKVIIKISAIIVSIIIGTILFTAWVCFIPFAVVLDLIIFMLEMLIDNKNNHHNYIAISFIIFYYCLKQAYNDLIDDENFKNIKAE